MRRGRSLQPVATVARGRVRMALRLFMASMPLVPVTARADASVPEQRQKTPVAPVLMRVPPPPGAMPPPHLPEPRPPTGKKK